MLAMEREQILALLLSYRRLQKKKMAKNTSTGVHQINRKRKERGGFHVLFHQLREDLMKHFIIILERV